MSRFDWVFSLAALGLIAVSVVSLCKMAEYRTQAKFATARYEEMKADDERVKREAARRVSEVKAEVAAEWKGRIQKVERKMAADCQVKLAKRDEQIEMLRGRMLKLSNDAVKVIAQYRSRSRASNAVPAISPVVAGDVVDRYCPQCSGRGKIMRKETCVTCGGRGYSVRTSPGGVTRIDRLHFPGDGRAPIFSSSDNGRIYRYNTTKDRCSACSGKGWTNRSADCQRCGGDGRIPLKE